MMFSTKERARILGLGGATLVVVAFLLLPQIPRVTSASTEIYLDWQVQNPVARGRLVISDFPLTLCGNQTYKVSIELTVESVESGDNVNISRIDWRFDDGSAAGLVLGYSMPDSSLNETNPLSLTSHWSLQKTPANATGWLKIDAEVTLMNSTYEWPAQSLQFGPSVRMIHRTESRLTLSQPSDIQRPETVRTNGTLDRSRIVASIELTYTKPDGSKVIRHVTTDSSGFFTDEYVPDAEGGWSVKAAWSGDEFNLESSSNTVAFTVGPIDLKTPIAALVGILAIVVVSILTYFVQIPTPPTVILPATSTHARRCHRSVHGAPRPQAE